MTREHMDFTDMDDETRGRYGVLSARLCRVMSALPHIGRVHVGRWGTARSTSTCGSSRARLGCRGSWARWPSNGTRCCPPSMQVWRGDLDTVAASLRRAADAAT